MGRAKKKEGSTGRHQTQASGASEELAGTEGVLCVREEGHEMGEDRQTGSEGAVGR